MQSSSAKEDDKAIMKQSIEDMKKEARQRLEALSRDLSAYQTEIKGHPEESSDTTTTISHANSNKDSTDTIPWDPQEVKESHRQEVKHSPAHDESPRHKESKNHQNLLQDGSFIEIHHADIDRLENTRVSICRCSYHLSSSDEFISSPIPVLFQQWKVAFNLGREPGTWMPPTWATSGDRLRFSVTVELTSEPFYENEEFFDGQKGAKVLRVVEANLGPTFYDSEYHSQRSLQFATRGAYKIVRGAGPSGTDVLRFFLESTQDIKTTEKSDVVCPRGRIYGNCGYYPVYSTTDKNHPITHWKELLQKEYHQVAVQYDELQREAEEDERFFSLEQIARVKRIHELKNQLEIVEKRLHEAKQREPSKSQLRLSQKGDVGLSREGGVCLKVRKGMALEYHILGVSHCFPKTKVFQPL